MKTLPQKALSSAREDLLRRSLQDRRMIRSFLFLKYFYPQSEKSSSIGWDYKPLSRILAENLSSPRQLGIHLGSEPQEVLRQGARRDRSPYNLGYLVMASFVQIDVRLFTKIGNRVGNVKQIPDMTESFVSYWY